MKGRSATHDGSRALRMLIALALLVGLGEVVAHVYFAKRPPNDAEWRVAAQEVKRLRAPGELVVVAPYWAEPIARSVLGDEVMPIADVAREDDTRYRSLLEVSILGQHYSTEPGWTVTSDVREGKFLFRKWTNASAAVVRYNFLDHLNPTDASVKLSEGNKVCTWNSSAPLFAGGLGGAPTFPKARFTCPAPMHIFAGITVVEDKEFRPRRCIMMHAPKRGYFEATFHGVTLGQEIRGYTGLRWIIERERTGAPMQLEVLVDGESIGTAVHVDGESWKPWRFLLGQRSGRRADVAFRVSSQAEDRRQMCWEADTR